MCKFSSRLIAWLDNELPDAEAVAMGQHVPACRECREQADAFREVSHAFAVCARAVPPLAASSSRRWWLAPAAVAAAVLAVVLLWPRGHSNTRLEVRNQETVAPTPVAAAPHATAIAVHRSRVRRRVQQQSVVWQPVEPTIQIVIPADALFPPGAFPEGVGFVADLKLAVDGSAGSLALRP
jgi:hypothetical protein